ncbi:MAG: IS110 family transposase [Candidatus Latescibacteria bacterium]|nr:IS110 family transposase [Candidatus Latescibacterota bacterium]
MLLKKIVYVGIDVDDTAFHGAGVVLETGEFFEFRCKPDHGVLRKKLNDIFGDRYTVHLCYEACYIGYSLYRFLRKSGIHCDIIAPSLIPVKTGARVKTDRLDAAKLAEYYARDLLTPIYVPDETDEEVRDILRSRNFLVKQRKMLKTHILSAYRRYEINFLEETGSKTTWTDRHISWLKKRVKTLQRPLCQIDLELLLAQYTNLSESIEKLDASISRIADGERYKKSKDALNSFRGIDTLSAMTIIAELGDIRRFAHPRQLAGYVGLDVAEYSSGGKEHKKGITKTGNKHVRTLLTECCQTASNPPILSKRIKQSRAGQSGEVIDIADRCMNRLHKKSVRMLYAGKHKNKIKTACAREMLGFIWEALKLVA